jgi:hypothetical protein
LKQAIQEIRQIREDFWKNVRVPGKPDEFNQELEKAGRVADFLELGELMCMDALNRNESCGGHFREEYAETDGPQKAKPNATTRTTPTSPHGSGPANPARPNCTRSRWNFDERETDATFIQIAYVDPPGAPVPSTRTVDNNNRRQMGNMKLNLKIWRQAGPNDKGQMVTTRSTTSPRTCRSWRCSTC